VAKKKRKGDERAEPDDAVVAGPPQAAFTRPLALPSGPPVIAQDWRGVIRRLTGARLVYGKPIEASGRTVVPVASLRMGGGLGFGLGASDGADGKPPGTGRGGGGGGAVDARPLGFIDIGPEGARFEPIDKTGRLTQAFGRAVSSGGVAGGAAAGAVAGAAVVAGAVGLAVARRRNLVQAAVRAALPKGSRGGFARTLRR
jgi:uncharacterized spore protein YtfJ